MTSKRRLSKRRRSRSLYQWMASKFFCRRKTDALAL